MIENFTKYNFYRQPIFMKIALIFLTLFWLCACNTKSHENKKVISPANVHDTVPNVETPIIMESKAKENEESVYFVIIADTCLNYFTLHKKMFELHRNFNIPIDTMGRYFNKVKDLIVLPDNSEDEMYAGEYLPRRFPSSDLSLEYLKFYQSHADNKTIALVAGIYESEKEADSVLTVLQKGEKKIFKIKAKIYEDCIH